MFAQHHEIAQHRQSNREVHTELLLFLCAGGPWGTVGLCEESSVCHRIWDLILGCIWQLTDMVGVPYKLQYYNTANRGTRGEPEVKLRSGAVTGHYINARLKQKGQEMVWKTS